MPEPPLGCTLNDDQDVGFTVVRVLQQLVVISGEITSRHVLLEPDAVNELRMTLDKWKAEVASEAGDDNPIDRHRATKEILRGDGLAAFRVTLAQCIVAGAPALDDLTRSVVAAEHLRLAVAAQPSADLSRIAQSLGL